MEQIALYLQTNSDELIIVDIRNVYDLTRKLTKQLFSEFERSFASSLCRDLQCNKLHRLTLGQLTCNGNWHRTAQFQAKNKLLAIYLITVRERA